MAPLAPVGPQIGVTAAPWPHRLHELRPHVRPTGATDHLRRQAIASSRFLPRTRFDREQPGATLGVTRYNAVGSPRNKRPPQSSLSLYASERRWTSTAEREGFADQVAVGRVVPVHSWFRGGQSMARREQPGSYGGLPGADSNRPGARLRGSEQRVGRWCD